MNKQNLMINLFIKMKSPFFLGAGYRRGLVQKTVVRDAEGHLYIPGSTIKGKVRNTCEDLARRFFIPICKAPATESMCQTDNGCVICRIFGSPYRGESLFFDNAYLIDALKEQYSVETGELPYRRPVHQTWEKNQIMINRRLGETADGHLFLSEFGVPGLMFQGEISGFIELTPIKGNDKYFYELILLFAGLGMVHALGGEKSRGGGQCDIMVTKLFLNNQEVSATDFFDQMVELLDCPVKGEVGLCF